MAVTPTQGPVRFGTFEADLRAGELRKHGTKIKLQEQPFQVLQVLLEQPGQVVTREELQQKIWPADTFVDFDHGLNNAIRRLREALGDSAENPRFIETLSRRGYRFIAPVSTNSDAGAVQELVKSRWSPRSLRIAIMVGLGAVVLLVALLGLIPGKFLWRQSISNAAPEIRSLAVLPLQNLSADPTQEYFSDGMTDALITDLAQIGSLKIISRTSSMQYKQTKKSLPEIARELHVDGIIEGTVQRSGDRVRITAQLIYGASDKHLWAASYERDVRDVFGLERDIAGDVAHQLQARLTIQNQPVPPPTVPRPEQPRTVYLKALEAYLQGNYHLHKAETGPVDPDKEKREAQKSFQQAIDADANFAPAYVGLARAYQNLFWSAPDDFARMRAAAEKAVLLDPASSDAHVILGEVKGEGWDAAGEQAEYRRAIALNPNNAVAHKDLGDSLRDKEEAWREHEIAQQLDPNQDHLSWALYIRGEYDRAIELLLKLAETHPEDGTVHWELAQNYLQKSMYKEWVQELGTSMSLFGFPDIASSLHRAFATSGYLGAMRQWAREVERLNASGRGYFPGILAQAYTALGDKNRAFYWLEQGYAHRDRSTADPYLHSLDEDPVFAPLRSDPRYKDMLRRMGRPE
jgi:TolB-like protein/DNA-binding winged helix-turn-helix (wHTH) protein